MYAYHFMKKYNWFSYNQNFAWSELNMGAEGDAGTNPIHEPAAATAGHGHGHGADLRERLI